MNCVLTDHVARQAISRTGFLAERHLARLKIVALHIQATKQVQAACINVAPNDSP